MGSILSVGGNVCHGDATSGSRTNAISLPNDDNPHSVETWDGDRQRAHLKGFARLRAIWWRRSLRLYQHWVLGRHDWYWPLLRSLDGKTSGFDTFSRERVKGAADLFGETPVLTTVRLLEIAEAVSPKRPSLFVDLGCGRGVTCLTAASVGVPSVGYEQEMSWVQAARQVAEERALSATFESGDFLEKVWPGPALFLVVATSFPEQLKEEIALRLSTQSVESMVFTADWDLSRFDFQKLWEGRLPVDWGTAHFALWSRR